MRLLVDNALSPALADALRSGGHDVLHVRDLGLEHATDTAIFAAAADERRIVVSADTDFGTLLALRGEREPSVLLWRRTTPRRPEAQAPAILDALARAERDLRSGAVVVVGVSRLRIRRLPIGGDAP